MDQRRSRWRRLGHDVARLATLSPEERRALAQALLALAAVRLALRAAPFQLVHQLTAGLRPRPPGPSPARIRWAVSVASRAVPGATCLPQALAAQALLRRAGLPAELRLGVRAPGEAFQAHAWVVSGEDVVIGDPGPELYELPPLSA